MLKRKRQRIGQSLLEYIIVIIFVSGAFVVFQTYIKRGLAGRWKAVGDSFGQGRRYDAYNKDDSGKTIECRFDFAYNQGWYDADCYREDCDCFTINRSDATCKDCIAFCASPKCAVVEE
ncbi:MAG TPA: hypothetical protein DD723_10450 [Candidatus Omnitrophica bacterium]|nr:MAG: hypothetical protein A2Z81_03555 [Omnitrophica WOR_2 bacterium GWA2_45_18]OGX18427.1 MAG: hypothetical protein A2Y04_00750 [Omnitrophica WOR_2 bacterium GWC2_45_7]HBR15936.1 hypothetical protein [Candidatus Omnitrophota bacterium]